MAPKKSAPAHISTGQHLRKAEATGGQIAAVGWAANLPFCNAVRFCTKKIRRHGGFPRSSSSDSLPALDYFSKIDGVPTFRVSKLKPFSNFQTLRVTRQTPTSTFSRLKTSMEANPFFTLRMRKFPIDLHFLGGWQKKKHFFIVF